MRGRRGATVTAPGVFVRNCQCACCGVRSCAHIPLVVIRLNFLSPGDPISNPCACDRPASGHGGRRSAGGLRQANLLVRVTTSSRPPNARSCPGASATRVLYWSTPTQGRPRCTQTHVVRTTADTGRPPLEGAHALSMVQTNRANDDAPTGGDKSPGETNPTPPRTPNPPCSTAIMRASCSPSLTRRLRPSAPPHQMSPLAALPALAPGAPIQCDGPALHSPSPRPPPPPRPPARAGRPSEWRASAPPTPVAPPLPALAQPQPPRRGASPAQRTRRKRRGARHPRLRTRREGRRRGGRSSRRPCSEARAEGRSPPASE